MKSKPPSESDGGFLQKYGVLFFSDKLFEFSELFLARLVVGVRAAGDSGGSSVGEKVGREGIVLVGLSFLFVSEIGNIVGLTAV